MSDLCFHCEVDEICTVLGYYAAYSDNSLPKFQDGLLVRSSKVKKSNKKAFFLDLLMVEDGNDRLSQNIS
jgi:hypothetical protein